MTAHAPTVAASPLRASRESGSARRFAEGKRPAAETGSDTGGEARHQSPLRTWAMRIFWVAALGVGAWLIHRTLERYGFDAIVAAVTAIPAHRLALAGAFAAASYGCLTLFDFLGTRYVGRPLAWRKVATASFVSLSLGHSIGFAGLSSGAIRYRFYRRWGLGVADVARLVVFCGLTVGLGLTVLAGIALLAEPWLARDVTGLSVTASRTVGALCLALAAGYVLLSATLTRPLRLWRWTVEIPGLRLAVAQIVVGTVNFALVAACLHQALAVVAEAPYLGVASVYVLANVATLITHVPGGLGVIESVVTSLVPGAQVIGAVVVFRVVYFIVPLAIGATTLALVELRLAWRRRKAVAA